MKTAAQKAASGPGLGLGEGALVDRQWLDAHLLDPRVRVVEVDVSPVAYDDWHIDGAVLWNVYTDLKDAGYRTVGTATLERLVARSGIGLDSTVVFYGYAPALGLWLMKLHGHPDVRILDCSRDTWRARGHPWSTAASELPADGYRLDGAPPARPGMLRRRRAGPRRNRARRRNPGRPAAHPPRAPEGKRLPLPHASPRRPGQPGRSPQRLRPAQRVSARPARCLTQPSHPPALPAAPCRNLSSSGRLALSSIAQEGRSLAQRTTGRRAERVEQVPASNAGRSSPAPASLQMPIAHA